MSIVSGSRNAPSTAAAAASQVGRRGRMSGQVHEPSAASPTSAIAAHNPLQVAFTNAALSIAFVLQQNMARQQQQITLMNSYASQQFQSTAAGVFPGHIPQHESVYPLQPLLPTPTVAAPLPPPTSGPPLLGPVAHVPQQQHSPYFVHGAAHPLQGGSLYAAAMTPYVEALPAPATVVLPKTDCNSNNIQL